MLFWQIPKYFLVILLLLAMPLKETSLLFPYPLSKYCNFSSFNLRGKKFYLGSLLSGTLFLC